MKSLREGVSYGAELFNAEGHPLKDVKYFVRDFGNLKLILVFGETSGGLVSNNRLPKRIRLLLFQGYLKQLRI